MTGCLGVFPQLARSARHPRQIEESLRKASHGGGRNPLVPVAIDDYVYKKWTPKSRDLATYVRDLVIGDFRKVLRSKTAFEKEVDRLVTALAEG